MSPLCALTLSRSPSTKMSWTFQLCVRAKKAIGVQLRWQRPHQSFLSFRLCARVPLKNYTVTVRLQRERHAIITQTKSISGHCFVFVFFSARYFVAVGIDVRNQFDWFIANVKWKIAYVKIACDGCEFVRLQLDTSAPSLKGMQTSTSSARVSSQIIIIIATFCYALDFEQQIKIKLTD